MSLEMKVTVREPYKIRGVLPWLLHVDRRVKHTAQGEPLGVLFLDVDGRMDPSALLRTITETPLVRTVDWAGYFFVESSRGHYHFIVLAPYTFADMVRVWAHIYGGSPVGALARDFHRWMGKCLVTGQPVLRVGPKEKGGRGPQMILWRHLRIPKGSSVWSWAVGYQHYRAQRYTQGVSEGLCPLIQYPNRKGTLEFEDMKEVIE